MSLDADDEILQDFLVEAGEILEQLGEQLVDLELQPEDADLLNAIFRGFHTVKGGAGFLSIGNLVEISHRAEDVFSALRQGERQVTAELMDPVLQALDVINDMMAQVGEGSEPPPADRDLIANLERFAKPEAEDQAAAADEPAPEVEPEAEPEAVADTQVEDATTAPVDAPNTRTEAEAAPGDDDITEAEFDALLDELHGKGRHGGVPKQTAEAAPKSKSTPRSRSAAKSKSTANTAAKAKPAAKAKATPKAGTASKTKAASETGPAQSSEDITEDEFEALLDELHGKGRHGGVPKTTEDAASGGSGEQETAAGDTTAASDDISEEEFDALLDELHGKGRHGGVPKQAARQASDKAAPAKPAVAPGPAKKSPAPAAVKPATPAKPEAKTTAAKRQATDKQQAAKSAGETTVRVDTQRLDDIMNMVGELVLVRNRLATLKSSTADEELTNAIGNLDVVTADLQLAVMKTRMQPVKKVFGRFPRVVRDLARNLEKEVDLIMQGEDTDLDKNLVEALADPLVHLVRNAVDHGVESPEEREAVGKPRRGKVVLSAAQEGDHILLSIEDDGKGMDAAVLRHKAVEKGIMEADAVSRLDNKDVFNLIFAAGFSTKTEVSDVSGRGVGMDVVKTRIAQMNGQVEVDSQPGHGTKIIVKLPLTLAILPTLMVILGRQPFALPLASVVEIFNLDLGRTNMVNGQLTIRVRDRALPLFYLRKWLVCGEKATPDYSDGSGHVVVVNVGGIQVGLVVDFLVGQEEVVIKPLGAMLQGLEGMAGATITGDGKIALILDVPGLMRRHARRM